MEITVKILITLFILLVSFFSSNTFAITVTDSRSTHPFNKTPQRVVALGWTIVENLIELGITPVAVAGKRGYSEWVRHPALPNKLIDVGTRQEPNIERIAELKPDVIIIGDQQSDLIAKLERIAPVLAFNSYRHDHNNYQAARQNFLELASLFQRKPEARQKLAYLDKHLLKLKEKLLSHFNKKLPNITCVRFNNMSVLWVYGDNSMPQFALEMLGFKPALPQPTSQWGVTQKKVIELGKIKTGIVLYIEPFDQAEKLFLTPLWKAMPFVRSKRFAAIAPTWTYGGPMSIQYLAEAMTNALLHIEP